MTSSIYTDITEWIKKVSVAHEKLGNKSICPFAKNAKFQIIQVSALDVDPVSYTHLTLPTKRSV